MTEDDLTPAERAAIGALPREAVPPAYLEDATVALLRDRGLLTPMRIRRGRRVARLAAGLAAAALLFVGGLLLGRRHPAAQPASAGPRFVLLLYEGPEYTQPPAGREMDRVREYGAWARTHAAGGEIEGGEKLKDSGEMVIGVHGEVTASQPAPGSTRLAGFFLIRAVDKQSALAIAKTCPHVRHGGSIVIREIEPT